ncbi:MAG: hypothetical protein VYA59_07555 [Pseudomonadota bacterium]|nr:hypothetical protein [Pseudomonadota bacterium]
MAREVGLDLDHGQFCGGSDGNFTGGLGIPTQDGHGVCGDGYTLGKVSVGVLSGAEG